MGWEERMVKKEMPIITISNSGRGGSYSSFIVVRKWPSLGALEWADLWSLCPRWL